MSVIGEFFKAKKAGDRGQMFRALCQNDKCKDPRTKERTQLGGLHIPALAGRAFFVCYRCGTVSEFTQGSVSLEAANLGQIDLPPAR